MGIFADALKKKKVKTGVSVNALPGSTHKDDTENIPQNVEKAKSLTEKHSKPVASVAIATGKQQTPETQSRGSNKQANAGEKQEWLNSTGKSDAFDASIKNTRSYHELASETKDFDASEKTEYSKPASKASKKSVEKTHSSESIDDPLKLEIVSSNRRKVTIYFSACGEETKLEGEDAIVSTSYCFQIRYNDLIVECKPGKNDYICGQDPFSVAVRKIARLTSSHPSAKEILESIESRLQTLKMKDEKRTKVYEYFAEKYPELWSEIKEKGIWYFIEKSEGYHLGDEDVKLLALMSFKMLFTKKRKRIGVLVLGDIGAGKSHAIESIVSMIPDGYYYNVVDVTPKSVVYLGKNGSDYLRWKLLYLQEITNLRALKLLSMLMTAGRGGSLTVVDGEPVDIFLDYAPSVITSVVNLEEADSSQRKQILSRFIPVAILREKKDIERLRDKVHENENREEDEFNYDEQTKLGLLAWVTYTPKFAFVPKNIYDKLVSSLPFSRTISLRIASFATFTLQILATLLNKKEVDEETLDLFKKYLLRKFVIASFGVSEVEIKLLKYLYENRAEKLKTSQVASDNSLDPSTVKELLMELVGYGLVEFEKPGSVYLWSITDDGIKLLGMLEEIKTDINNVSDVIEVRENGKVVGAVNAKFFRDDDGGGAEEGAVPGADGTAVRGGERGMDSIMEAYQFLKEHGWFLTTDLVAKFGVGVLEALKKKDLVTFNVVDGAEYVGAK
jgi:predicted transcriptional regulator